MKQQTNQENSEKRLGIDDGRWKRKRKKDRENTEKDRKGDIIYKLLYYTSIIGTCKIKESLNWLGTVKSPGMITLEQRNASVSVFAFLSVFRTSILAPMNPHKDQLVGVQN